MADEENLPTKLIEEPMAAHLGEARTKIAGSGISETRKVSADLAPRLFSARLAQQPWRENRDMIEQLFTPIFQRSWACPGRGKVQCCQAQPGEACCPNWLEREDPEWYAREINSYLSLVNQRVKSGTPASAALAADEAFELGCLFTEALIKFQWDAHAKRGKGTLESATEGGQSRRHANPYRLSAEETVAAIDDLIASGMGKGAAYGIVAEQQHVESRTVGKEYNRLKKSVAHPA